MRMEFDHTPEKFQLMLAVPDGDRLWKGYDFLNLVPQVDMLNLMSVFYATFNIVSSLNKLMELGVPASKLAVGVATDGMVVSSLKQHCVGADCIPFDVPVGECTQDIGLLSYAEIARIQSHHPVRLSNDTFHKYLEYKQAHQIIYQDPLTIRKQLQFAASLCIRGMTVWFIDYAYKTNLIEESLFGPENGTGNDTIASKTNSHFLLDPIITPIETMLRETLRINGDHNHQ